MELLPISQLHLDPSNSRKHSKKNLDAIKGSLAKFGQQKPIVISADNIVIAGNGTLQAAKTLGWNEIGIIRSDLKGSDAVAYGIADNRTSDLAEWDQDILAKTLKSLAEEIDLVEIGFEADDLTSLENVIEGKLDDDDYTKEDLDKDDIYTKKIKSPIYQPNGEKPEIESLIDLTKSEELLKEIESSTLHEDDKKFLRLAAERHNVFSYDKIAEYYAHAPKELQELMEKSALVIIDFNKAIEQGFVALSEDIAKAYQNDN